MNLFFRSFRMKTSHCVLLFALIALASAASDNDTTQGQNEVKVCEDNQDICPGLVGRLMCQLPSAGVRMNSSSYQSRFLKLHSHVFFFNPSCSSRQIEYIPMLSAETNKLINIGYFICHGNRCLNMF